MSSEEQVVEVPPVPSPEHAKAPAPLLVARPNGQLIPTTLEDQFRLAKYYHHSNLMPRGLDTTEKVLVALQLCFELGLPPMTCIGKIAVINGVPMIFGELPLALVQRSGKLLKCDEWWFDKEGKRLADSAPPEQVAGATCEVVRHGMDSMTRSFTVKDATTAKLWGKVSSEGKPTPWVLYPKRMLQMRARSWALKDRFGDVLMGIAIAEYDNDHVVEIDGRLVNQSLPPSKDVSQELNEAYLSKKEETKGHGGTT